MRFKYIISGRTLLLTAALAVAAWAAISEAATLPPNFTESIITEPITKATAMAFAPDGKLFILEQHGLVQVYEGTGAGMWTQIAPNNNFFDGDPLDISFGNERGLDGIVFDPDYLSNRYIYFFYAKATPQVHNRVSRYTANASGTQVVPGSEAVIIDLENVNSNIHNGGAMHFGADGKLYVSVGDDSNPAHSQSINTRFGKMLRLNPDPNNPIPADNPTSINGIPGTLVGDNRAIWAAGLRNPFTCAIHPLTGRMHINDVGQATYEEINLGAAGANYGWGVTEGPFDQLLFPDFTHPMVAYPHPNNGQPNYPVGNIYTGYAVTGGTFYVPATPNFPSNYVGRYFFADFTTAWIKYYDSDTNQVYDFATGAEQPVDLDVGPDGALYYLARFGKFFEEGWVYRIDSTLPPCPADLAGTGSPNLPDGAVDVFDLFVLLSNWGTNGAGANLAADLNVVDVFDLFALLSAWGDC